MKASVTSKEEILQVCRSIVADKGLLAVNMRSVAAECHIALGTLYNYYSDKDELLIATIESIWKEIFHMNMRKRKKSEELFSEYVSDMYECIQKGAEEYPDFFTAHSISIARAKRGEAKSTMEHYFAHMKEGMRKVLEADCEVSEEAFSYSFTESEFIDFVLNQILLLLIQKKANCEVLIEIIRRVIYR